MDIPSLVLERNGYNAFNPVQKMAIEEGVTEGTNILVSSPTASGKTLIGELAMVSSIIKGKIAVYTSPLKALASEHYKDFKRKYPEFSTALSTGDYDAKDEHLGSYNAIFTTYEKLDSLLRQGPQWLNRVGVLVVDEIHMLDSDRGPTLEILLTRMKGRVQIVGLSATVPNDYEIADWLGAKLVKSDWRPVPLKEGVYYDGQVVFPEKREEWGEIEEIIEKVLSQGKSVLIFSPTRKSAVSTARKLREVGKKFARRDVEPYVRKVLEALESPTEQCKELAEDMLYGVAFHHAGLVSQQREAVEDAFRSGKVRIVVATPTLAAGVNLPSYMVIISSVKRMEDLYTAEITVREYKQMVGRAGRPKYDKEGIAITMAKSETEASYIMEKYVLGEPEEVLSRLSSRRSIRFHLLGLIKEGIIKDEESALTFFSNTLFFRQKRDIEELELLIKDSLKDLENWGMIEAFSVTRLGRRVASLYIDPETGYQFSLFAKGRKIGSFPYLFTVSSTWEMYPYLPVGKREEINLLVMAEERKDELTIPFDELIMDIHFLNKFKLALLLEAWIEERDEDSISKEFGVFPGILRGILTNAEWLSYSLGEIARLEGNASLYNFSLRMTERIKHGIKEELIPLVQIKGIGRIRARKLYSRGIKTPEDIKRAPPALLSSILGYKTALNILKQLKISLSEEDKREMRKGEQSTLDEFL